MILYWEITYNKALQEVPNLRPSDIRLTRGYDRPPWKPQNPPKNGILGPKIIKIGQVVGSKGRAAAAIVQRPPSLPPSPSPLPSPTPVSLSPLPTTMRSAIDVVFWC